MAKTKTAPKRKKTNGKAKATASRFTSRDLVIKGARQHNLKKTPTSRLT